MPFLPDNNTATIEGSAETGWVVKPSEGVKGFFDRRWVIGENVVAGGGKPGQWSASPSVAARALMANC